MVKIIGNCQYCDRVVGRTKVKNGKPTRRLRFGAGDIGRRNKKRRLGSQRSQQFIYSLSRKENRDRTRGGKAQINANYHLKKLKR